MKVCHSPKLSPEKKLGQSQESEDVGEDEVFEKDSHFGGAAGNQGDTASHQGDTTSDQQGDVVDENGVGVNHQGVVDHNGDFVDHQGVTSEVSGNATSDQHISDTMRYLSDSGSDIVLVVAQAYHAEHYQPPPC